MNSSDAYAGKPGVKAYGTFALATVAAVVAVASAGYYRAGSIEAVPEWLSGRRLVTSTPVVSLGELDAGDIVETQACVRNISGEPEQLSGAQTSCSCVATPEFPIDVPGHTEVIVDFKVLAPSRPGEFSESVRMFSKSDPSLDVVVTFSGVVRSDESELSPSEFEKE